MINYDNITKENKNTQIQIDHKFLIIYTEY